MATRKPLPGMWPLLVAGALFLLATPVAFVVDLLVKTEVDVAAAVVAIAFLLAALAALAASTVAYLHHSAKGERGIPIAGIALGLIAALVAATVLLPLALR